MKQILVTINPDGTVEVSAEGYKGKGCESATKFLEDALGLDTKGRKKTSDYYAQETVKLGQKA